MKRTASAIWEGDLKTGKGSLSSASGVLKSTPYSFATRFGDTPGTNPEELIAAAHAGCFTMALSAQLAGAGVTAERLETTATVTMEKLDKGWTITAVHLELKAKIPGASREAFEIATAEAKANCPVSRVLNAKITMTASLEA